MKMLNKLNNQKGQAAMEYAVIAVVILAVIAIAFQAPLTAALNAAWAKVQAGIAAF